MRTLSGSGASRTSSTGTSALSWRPRRCLRPGSSRSSSSRPTTAGSAKGMRRTSATCPSRTSTGERARRCSPRPRKSPGHPARGLPNARSHSNARSPPAVSWRCCSASATSENRRSRRAGTHSTRPPTRGHRPAIIRFSPGSEPGFGRGVAPHPVSADSEADRIALQNASQARLFWEAVERLMQWCDAGRAGSAESVLIDYLAEASASLDPRVQAGVRRLRDTLESLTGLADATASELFERHDTPLAHAMTLFFLRRDCADLFDYRSDRLGETDWLAAAILFGVRDGWLSLPLRLRGQSEVSAAVSHRMAQMSHRSPARTSTSAEHRQGSAPSANSSAAVPPGARARGPPRWTWPEHRSGIAFIPGSTSVPASTISRSKPDRRKLRCPGSRG